jgi:hypothetical protein
MVSIPCLGGGGINGIQRARPGHHRPVTIGGRSESLAGRPPARDRLFQDNVVGPPWMPGATGWHTVNFTVAET